MIRPHTCHTTYACARGPACAHMPRGRTHGGTTPDRIALHRVAAVRAHQRSERGYATHRRRVGNEASVWVGKRQREAGGAERTGGERLQSQTEEHSPQRREKESSNRAVQHEQRRSHALHAQPLHRTHSAATLTDHAHPFSFPLHKASDRGAQR